MYHHPGWVGIFRHPCCAPISPLGTCNHLIEQYLRTNEYTRAWSTKRRSIPQHSTSTYVIEAFLQLQTERQRRKLARIVSDLRSAVATGSKKIYGSRRITDSRQAVLQTSASQSSQLHLAHSSGNKSSQNMTGPYNYWPQMDPQSCPFIWHLPFCHIPSCHNHNFSGGSACQGHWCGIMYLVLFQALGAWPWENSGAW